MRPIIEGAIAGTLWTALTIWAISYLTQGCL